MITLAHDLDSIHHDLEQRFELAASARPDETHPRGHYAPIDTFLAVASRHNAGMLESITPLARRTPTGEVLAGEYVAASRRYEESLAQVKAKLYGSTFTTGRPWSDIWADVRSGLVAVHDLERRLADALVEDARDPDEDLGTRLHHAELSAPTRPHPFIPHRGVPGHVARRVARRIDQFWDTTEGRMIPHPVRHHDRAQQGRFVQYVLADPHLPGDDEG